ATLADPLSLKLYLAAGPALRPLAERHLRKRLAKGKEDPNRVDEKRGIASVDAPSKVIWCHAVGVGEALALTGFTAKLRTHAPDHTVLLTTSSRNAAEVLIRNLPDGAIHQFLPLDVPPFVGRFLDHWKPRLAIWAERDIWPRLMVEAEARGIPQMIINGRMSDQSLRQKQKAKRLFEACYARCAFIDVQDARSAENFEALVPAADISVGGSLKAFAPMLADDPAARAGWEQVLPKGKTWLAASIHSGEFEEVLEVHAGLLANGWTSVMAPRNPDETDKLIDMIKARGLHAARASDGITADADIIVEDRLGYLGLWYRLAAVAFLGGSWDETGGHNPYEAARLGCPFFYGSNVANFADDYAVFEAAGLDGGVASPTDLIHAVEAADLKALSKQVKALSDAGEDRVDALAARCAALLHHAE
ncbi:MAG: glycosyltransferase N-terminal domain-containing protein, partial [Pseudomonadota bacterium]